MKILITYFILLSFNSLWSQDEFEFDSIKYNTYVYPAVYNIHLTKDSIKFIAIKSGWESWIYLDKYKGVTLKNATPSYLWKDIQEDSKLFYNDIATDESGVRTHSHKSEIEWFKDDSLIFFISFYPDSPRNQRLKIIHDNIYKLTKLPNNQLWKGNDFCSYSFLNKIDSIIIKKIPNKKSLRKPYDISSWNRFELIEEITNKEQIKKLQVLFKSGKKTNPLTEDIYLNLFKKENYYLLEFYNESKKLKTISYYNKYLRTSQICWTCIKKKYIINSM